MLRKGGARQALQPPAAESCQHLAHCPSSVRRLVAPRPPEKLGAASPSPEPLTPSPRRTREVGVGRAACHSRDSSLAFLLRSTTKPAARSLCPSTSPGTRTKSTSLFSRASWASGCCRGEASRRPSCPPGPPSSTSWCRTEHRGLRPPRGASFQAGDKGEEDAGPGAGERQTPWTLTPVPWRPAPTLCRCGLRGGVGGKGGEGCWGAPTPCRLGGPGRSIPCAATSDTAG